MTGDSVIALANQIVQARAVVNESIALFGPDRWATRRARQELASLQRQARILFR
ncbi:hypothetical protein SEA_LAHQTEMISH_53 [Microbacterium phage Lahqtemish]|uniref:hypothetical protein n=1 Tax=Microbacterium phage Lahqtemish TaxID=2776867 RepID=UPI0018A4DB1C|nr:hypothetical protein QDW25_gp53 [Microbacterium phage Lahqtemish]QOP66644.1 hypothetical protein SEA_LAHQTEMISH_53 [Microbacterium phage Lahqtemish]